MSSFIAAPQVLDPTETAERLVFYSRVRKIWSIFDQPYDEIPAAVKKEREEYAEESLEIGIALYHSGLKEKTRKRIEIHEEAVSHLEKAVKERGSAQDNFWLGATLTRLGDIKPDFESIELFEKSIPYLERAKELDEDIDNLHFIGTTFSKLGNLKKGEER